MDGGDNETRRRGACDLLRSMCKHYEEQTTRICSGFVAAMYQEYSVNREANWRSKDAAVSVAGLLLPCVVSVLAVLDVYDVEDELSAEVS